jgi:hypothetical protein
MYEIGRLQLHNKQFFIQNNKTFKKCFYLSKKESEILIQTKKEFGNDLYILFDPFKNIIIETLGFVSNTLDDHKIFYHLFTLNWLSDKKYDLLFNNIVFNTDLSQNRIVFNSLIYTMDPPNSIDLDDGFSIINDYEIYIHIADPMSFLNLSNHFDIFNELYKRLSTCYTFKIRHLFPLSFIHKVSLLNDDSLKRTISLYLKFDKNYDIIEYKFINLLTKNIINLTYNDNKLIHYNYLFQKIIQKYNPSLDKFEINHKWIETLMILFNYYFAKYFISQNQTFIGRSQLNKNQSNLPIYKYFNFKATYDIMSKDSLKPHLQLNLPYYCHGSSPLRRFIDLLNHSIFYQNSLLNLININDINHKLKLLKLYSSSYDIISILQINNLFNAFILDLDDTFITLIIHNPLLTRPLKTIKPLNYNDLKINQEIMIKVYYDVNDYKGVIIPFKIIIL